MAASVAALIGLWSTGALALSLGRVSVQSALGEPLRAEVDIPEINAEEASSLKAVVASPEAFRLAGMEYNAAMPGVRVALQRRADGRAYLRLSSDRPINEPFVDLILEASWATGRIVRDYTMLFDPVSMRQPAAAGNTTPAQTTAVTPARPPVAAAPAPAPAPRAAAPAAVTRSPTPEKAPVAVAKPAPTPANNDGSNTVTVKSGDTASKIAATTKPASISLDQMLVALLKANPDAFIDGNINRMKAGAVMNVPGAEQASATAPEAASQMVLAQSKDFNEFRRKLASGAPSAQVGAADRQASGSVQASVEDKKPAAAAPDKLTLSKGAVAAKAAEAQLAKDRAEKEATERAAELAKNISDLGKLGAATSGAAPAAAGASAATAAADAVPAVGVQVPVATITPPATAASETAAPVVAAASSPAPEAAAPVASAPVGQPPVVVQAPVAEPGLIDQLLENPLVPAGAGGLVALLAGFAFYRSRQRKAASQIDSAYLESRLQPDSFFGASGGQRVDTKDGGLTASSMVYSPSQLEAADDVDPVAEADVYLAYGRDLQAEEILKEAQRTNPGRIAIHQKLLEIYAKRQDTKAFETVAREAHKLVEGEGAAWDRICELGMGIDPNNELYQSGATPTASSTLSKPIPFESGSGFAASTVTLPIQVHQSEPEKSAFLDLDLDFSQDDSTSAAAMATASAQLQTGTQVVDTASASLPSLDLALPGDSVSAPAEIDSVQHAKPLDFDLPSLDLDAGVTPSKSGNEELARQARTSFGTTEPAALNRPVAHDAPLSQPGMLEFDMGSLSLDLEDSSEGTSASGHLSENEDPLATKLALAEEFVAIGDSDGARALIEEVIAEASGEVKSRAQLALNELN